MNRSRNFSHLRLPSKHTKHHQRLNSHYSLRFLWKKEFVFSSTIWAIESNVLCYYLRSPISNARVHIHVNWLLCRAVYVTDMFFINLTS
jgi:hypothetical protein